MLSLLLFTATLTAPAPFEPTQVAIFDVVVDNMPGDFERILLESLASGVAEGSGIEVISRDDVRAIIDVEAQKQLAGCDDSSCIMEIAGALDVDGAVAGTVSLVGDRYTGVVKLIDLRQARVYKRVVRDVDRESRLPAMLRVLGIEVMGGEPDPALLADLGPEAPAPVTTWNAGARAGVLFGGKHYVEEIPVDTTIGYTVIASADFAVAERISVGAHVQVSGSSYEGDVPLTLLTAGPTIKLRLTPIDDLLQIRFGAVLGFQLGFVDYELYDEPVGTTQGFAPGISAEVVLSLAYGLRAVLDGGFLTQPYGGNDQVTLAFGPQWYVTAGVEYAGL